MFITLFILFHSWIGSLSSTTLPTEAQLMLGEKRLFPDHSTPVHVSKAEEFHFIEQEDTSLDWSTHKPPHEIGYPRFRRWCGSGSNCPLTDVKNLLIMKIIKIRTKFVFSSRVPLVPLSACMFFRAETTHFIEQLHRK